MKAIIIGAGFSGAVSARLLAEHGYSVDVYEERPYIGGNAHDYVEDDIVVHKYGPHIFHTNDEVVYKFITKYGAWNNYHHTVLASIDGKLVPLPFNFHSLYELFDNDKAGEIEHRLVELYGKDKNISIMELLQSQDEVIKPFAEYVFNKVFKNYTLKQWGCSAEQLPKGIFDRVPVKSSCINGYFTDKYQLMPNGGYTAVFENIVSHPNISMHYNSKPLSLGEELTLNGEVVDSETLVIYTGAVDELCDNVYGALNYRSLRFEFIKHNYSSYQPCSVVNYPNEHDYTRITEFSKFTCAPAENTIVIKEYSLKYKQGENTPYYPIENKENLVQYNKYVDLISKYENVHLLGRLAEYKYINMDVAIANAIKLCESIIK